MSTQSKHRTAGDRAHRGPPPFVLGTAQLGRAYGIANVVGCPSEEAAVAIVRLAVLGGVRDIDTAHAYGDAERRVGVALAGGDLPAVRIVTKLSPLAGLDVTAAGAAAAVAVARESLSRSRTALRRERLDAVLLHRAAQRTAWDGAVWRWLCGEVERGAVAALGVSVQSPEELRAALEDPQVRQVQLPFNILDHRWREAGLEEILRHREDVVVHVRSSLLQGLLAGAADTPWPDIDGVDPADITGRLHHAAASCARSDPVDLCIAYVRAMGWVDGVVVGTETLDQTKRLAELFARAPLSAAAAERVRASIPRVPDRLLDPAQWRSAEAGSTVR